MNRKRNISYIKPEDPKFLKVLKKQVGYDECNHKFDKLECDFVDNEENELPQVVVLKQGDLTAEEAEQEKIRIEKAEAEVKADLKQRVIFKSKKSKETLESKEIQNKSSIHEGNKKQLLSFADEESEDDT